MNAIHSCTTKHCSPVVPPVRYVVAFHVPIRGSRSAHKLVLHSQELHMGTAEHFAMLTILLLLTLHAYLSRCNMSDM